MVAAVERRRRWVLAGLLLLDLALLMYLGRGLTFYFDEWNFVSEDYGGGLHALLKAHVGNISVFPILAYKVLFHLAGLNHYAVYRLAVALLHLLAAGLLYVLAARRVRPLTALLATAMILFLGAAWEDLLWPFQIGYGLSIVGGLGAWVLLDRAERRADVGAMLCVILAAGSSSLGLAVIAGVAVELAWQRRWRQAWIVLVPLALYGLWYLGYGESQVTEASLINAPGFVEDLAAAAFGALVGRALEWGRPLALLGAAGLLVGLARPTRVSPRLAGLIATGLSLWIVTALARSTISAPETSRYTYLGAVVIVLVCVEFVRARDLDLRALGLAIPAVAFFALTGLTAMHAGALGLRSTSQRVTAELGALELAAAHAPPGYQPDPQLAPQILAGPYLHTVRAIGSSPADSPARILASEGASRAAADGILIALETPKLAPVSPGGYSLAASAPTLLALTSGDRVQQGSCVALSPTARAGALTAVIDLPAGGVVIRDRQRVMPAVAMRRFAEGFTAIVTPPPPVGEAELTVAPDSATIPWQVQMTSSTDFSICSLLGH
ncbi:MAG TPA: hypothetical protein VGY13_09040 [Solirubrobacteraceae bacterium]|jgi:hypothetical protein|nr:hypothetical protein [Solirubrobacteraceae bacterium]